MEKVNCPGPGQVPIRDYILGHDQILKNIIYIELPEDVLDSCVRRAEDIFREKFSPGNHSKVFSWRS